MSFDDNTTKIIASVAGVLIAIAGGALLTIKKNKSKSKKYSNKQSDITITGNDNKVVGGDDKSTTIRK
jgi:hypothetical protein